MAPRASHRLHNQPPQLRLQTSKSGDPGCMSPSSFTHRTEHENTLEHPSLPLNQHKLPCLDDIEAPINTTIVSWS